MAGNFKGTQVLLKSKSLSHLCIKKSLILKFHILENSSSKNTATMLPLVWFKTTDWGYRLNWNWAHILINISTWFVLTKVTLVYGRLQEYLVHDGFPTCIYKCYDDEDHISSI